MTIELTGSGLTLEHIVQIARGNAEVKLAAEAEKRIVECRDMVERKIAAREIMYGINTGIGEFSEVILSDEQVKDFQRYLIYNHAAGIGEPAREEFVRAAMLSRANVHAKGRSGLRLDVARLLPQLLNRRAASQPTAAGCQRGSWLALEARSLRHRTQSLQ